MRINNSGPNPLSNPAQDLRANETAKTYGAERSERGERARRGESVSASDSAKAEISERARDLARAKSVAGSTPDVREEKIAELKRRIASGNYSVDSDKVADRMVDDHLHMGIG
jgi:negative regulator of flagellin synthesis FlgM